MKGYNEIRKYYEDGGRYVLAIVIVALTLVVGFILVNMTKAELQGNTLNISGLYSMKINVDKISDVSLKDSLPKDLVRVNGMDFFGRK